MKKIIFVVVLMLTLALALSACSLFESKCEHTYDSCSDTSCNKCGETRTALEHAYDSCDDTDCNNCGATRSALTHAFESCTDTKCDVCGATREAGAHVFDNCDDTICNLCSQVRPVSHNVFEIARVESTCTVAGNAKYYQCKDCNKLFANILATETLDAIPTLELADHALVDHEALAPTCDEEGYKAYQTCENCDYTTFEAIEATGHALETVEAQAPTCTEIGWEEYQACTNENCDYTEGYVELPATGHSYEDKEGLAPTCTEPGYEAYQECSVCHDIVGKETIDATGHTYSEEYSKDASYHWFECHCGHFEEKYMHTFENGVCLCGLNESDFVYPCEHTSKTYYERVAPTCVATGTEEYYVCDDPLCKAYLNANGNVIAEPVTIPVDPNAHDLTKVDAKAPTCTEIGWNEYNKCTRCDYTEYAELPATGHTPKAVDAVPPTCTETGLTAGSCCAVCGITLEEQEEVPATGHRYSHDCDATCEDCDYTRPEEELVHKYSHSCDPTCDNPGCTHVRPDEELEHVYSNEYDSTCNNEGCEEEREAETPDHGGTTLPDHNFGN